MKFHKAMKLMQKGKYIKFPSGRYLTISKPEYSDLYTFTDLNGSIQYDICISVDDILFHNWELFEERQ